MKLLPSHHLIRRSVSLAACSGALAGLASGQITEDIRFAPGDGAAGDHLGSSTALAGSLLVAGAPGDDDLGVDSGSAYVVDARSGAQLAKLLAADGSAGDQFGHSVAIADAIIVVGARFDGDNGPNSGSAYVFDATSGAQIHKLTAADGESGDEFGASVAVDGGLIVVGAKRDDDNGADAGAVYIFDAASGGQIAKQLAPDGAAGDNFGGSVDIDAGVVVVGAHGDDDNGPLSGSAYVFDASTGSLIAKLLAADGGTSDFFGASVAIDAGTVLVGAWADSVVFDHSGSAYLFDAATGLQRAKLVPHDAHDRDHFGIAVALEGGIAAIGAERDDDGGFDAGSAYVYDAQSGLELTKLLASDGDSSDRFGASVAIDRGRVASGASRDESHGAASGSVYLFGGPVCQAPRRYCGSTPNSGGTAGRISWQGSSSLAANDLDLQCFQVPPGEFGLFFMGPARAQIPLADGTLCVSGGLIRLPVVQVGANGPVSQSFNNTAWGPLGPGSTRHFQFWFRDPSGPGGMGANLSDALEVRFCN